MPIWREDYGLHSNPNDRIAHLYVSGEFPFLFSKVIKLNKIEMNSRKSAEK